MTHHAKTFVRKLRAGSLRLCQAAVLLWCATASAQAIEGSDPDTLPSEPPNAPSDPGDTHPSGDEPSGDDAGAQAQPPPPAPVPVNPSSVVSWSEGPSGNPAQPPTGAAGAEAPSERHDAAVDPGVAETRPVEGSALAPASAAAANTPPATNVLAEPHSTPAAAEARGRDASDARSFGLQWHATGPARDRAAGPPKEGAQEERLRALGVTLDAGFPDGVIAGAAYRPFSWLRLQAGAGTNSVSPGIRAGVVLVPFGSGPSLTLEAGHYFEGDANGIASKVAGSSYESNRVAQHVGYQFLNAHAGLELGQQRFTFFMHGGVSYLHARLHDLNDVLGGQANTVQGATTLSVNGDAVITALVPSLKLGFLVYLV
jgi:hypothetical protein